MSVHNCKHLSNARLFCKKVRKKKHHTNFKDSFYLQLNQSIKHKQANQKLCWLKGFAFKQHILLSLSLSLLFLSGTVAPSLVCCKRVIAPHAAKAQTQLILITMMHQGWWRWRRWRWRRRRSIITTTTIGIASTCSASCLVVVGVIVIVVGSGGGGD